MLPLHKLHIFFVGGSYWRQTHATFLPSTVFYVCHTTLGQEDPLEEGMATHSVFLSGKSHREEPGGRQSMG